MKNELMINTEDLQIKELQVKTIPSYEVAEMMGREHKEVLKMLEGQKAKDGSTKHVGIIQVISESGELHLSDYFIESTYKVPGNNKTYKCYECTKMGCDMLANKMTGEKGILFTAKYVAKFNEMEQVIQQLDRKQELQLKLFSNDPLEVVEAHKELVAMETAPLIAKIEEDKPKVTFADRVLKSKDNILVRQVAKIASDEGFTIGERKLYNQLREWNYICKNSTEPTQYGIDRGYFVVKLGTIDTPYGIKETRTTLVTPKGTVRIVERLLKENGIN